MDIELSDEQQQLMHTARRFLEKECPLSLVRQLETDDSGFSGELWRRMAELGWLGLPLPPEYGGAGMNRVSLAVLSRELGRALCPSPFISTVVLAGGAILRAGTAEQKRALLPRIVNGDAVIAFALQESNGYYDYRSVATTATPDGASFVLDGTKMFVEHAGAAERMLVIARTGQTSGPAGLTTFLVDGRSAGITVVPLGTMARDRQCKVVLDHVRVPATDVLGPVGGAWPIIEPVIHDGLVCLSGYMVGAAEKIHEMATEFAKERVQFGRPIGTFQAIQHYLAQTITEITSADTMTFYAAWTIDEGLPARAIVAHTKVCAGDTFRQASAIGAQIHGGIGFNEEVDTTLFLRRGKQLQLSMGDSGYWQDVIAAEVLDR